MKNTQFKEISIIGPGLIGASLGLILKNKKIAKKIIGIDISKKNINDAINNKSIDEGRLKIDEKIGRSDVVFICTPVSLIDYKLCTSTKKLRKILQKAALADLKSQKFG